MKLDKLKTAIQITGESCCEIDGKIHIAKNGVNTPITDSQQSEIDAQYVSDSANYDALAYARSRKEEYDKLNQFELISDDSINGTTTHKDAILAIKAKFPKG